MSTAAGVPDSLRDAFANRYTLERELGAGGMATVYLATDLRLQRSVAIKVLRPELGAALGPERFHREVHLLARLRHPFVLPLHDSGEVADSLYFVMPYIDGESLRARLARDSQLPIADAIEIIRQIGDALHYAHGEGVVHRDVKPENILLSRHGHALLADFGIARGAGPAQSSEAMTQVGMAIGTAAYMSPEQAMGEPNIDSRTDIYALGCVLYEMLAGRAPFTGTNALAVIAQHLTASPSPIKASRADVPPAIEQAILRTLEKDRGARFNTVADFVRELTDNVVISASHTAASPRGRLSIVVLPIVNIGGDAENEYFAEGLTEELTSALARLEGLRVVSRTSAGSFRGTDTGLGDIGTALGVGFVLQGSVRRAAGRLRMTAKLVRVNDDSFAWSEIYERAIDDIFAVQDEITRRIVDTITETLQLGQLRGHVPVQQTRSLRAYDLYLLGRHHWNKRSEAGMRRALELFEEAVEADPAYAPAYSGLADSLALLASWQFASPADMYPRAVAAAKRALELDPSSADAHVSLGFVNYNWEWDWDAAVREFQQAIALNPNHETAHRWLSAFLAGIGRDSEALPLARRVVELDPRSVLPHMNLGIIHLLAGRHEDSAAEFRQVLDMDPKFVRAHSFLGCAYSFSERHEEAIAAARVAVELSQGSAIVLMPLASCLARAGHTHEAMEMLETVFRTGLPAIYRAMLHSAFGNESAALEELERGFEERSDWMYSIGTQPWFREYHGHARFTRLLERLKLTPHLERANG